MARIRLRGYAGRHENGQGSRDGESRAMVDTLYVNLRHVKGLFDPLRIDLTEIRV